MSELAYMPLPAGGNSVPEWIHLMPAGSFKAVGGKKTYHVVNPDAVIKASLAPGKIVLDENHSTDLSARIGHPSPAAGWIVEMESRADGIWGRVNWTKRGRALMADQAYRGISPALGVDNKTNNVLRIARAALTNDPDLSLHSLHHKPTTQGNSEMTYPLSELRARLGLPAEADTTAINNALDGAKSGLSLHSKTAALAGLGASASGDEIVARLTQQQEKITLHSADASRLQSQLDELRAENARVRAESWVAEMGRKKVIPDQLMGEMITLHSTNAAMAEKIVAGLPDAPSEHITLHSRDQHNGTMQAAIPGMEAAEAALGLTADDIKAGGLT